MTSADEAARTAMRAYADGIEPPPVADIVTRAERNRKAPHPPSPARPRFRSRLVVVAAAAAVAIVTTTIAVGRLPDRGTDAAAPAQSATTTGVSRMAPACPPAPPVLEGSPLVSPGKPSKALAVTAGQRLRLTSKIPASDSHHRLLSFTVYLFPHGAQMQDPAGAAARSQVMQLASGQQSVSPVLQIPTGLPPGTYDVTGSSTYQGPSICGVANPPDSTMVGTQWQNLGSVVIN